MKSARRMIDNAKKLCKTKTNVAKFLGITQQRLDEYERGKRHMPAQLVMKLAVLANENSIRALGEYEAEWTAKKLGGVAAGLAALAFSAGVSYEALGAESSERQYPSTRYGECTLCARLRQIYNASARRVAGVWREMTDHTPCPTACF